MKGRQRRRLAAVGRLPAPDAALAAPKPEAAPAAVKQDMPPAASGAAEQKTAAAAASAAPPSVPKQEAGSAAATGAGASVPNAANTDGQASKRQRIGANHVPWSVLSCLGLGIQRVQAVSADPSLPTAAVWQPYSTSLQSVWCG